MGDVDGAGDKECDKDCEVSDGSKLDDDGDGDAEVGRADEYCNIDSDTDADEAENKDGACVDTD